MKSLTRVMCAAAAILIVGGLAIFTVAFRAMDFDFSKLNLGEEKTEEFLVTEPFIDLCIDSGLAAIRLAPSEDGTCRVVSRIGAARGETAAHTVEVKNGTLSIVGRRTWSFVPFFAFSEWKDPALTVYLPETEYRALQIHAGANDVHVGNEFTFRGADITAASGGVFYEAQTLDLVRIETGSGEIWVNCTVQSIEARTGSAGIELRGSAQKAAAFSGSGEIHLYGLNAEEITASCASGGIRLHTVCAAQEIRLETTSGDVDGYDVRGGVLTVRATSGDITLEHGTLDGALAVTVTSGDVSVNDWDAAGGRIHATSGSVDAAFRTEKVFDVASGSGRMSYPDLPSGGPVEVRTTSGDVHLYIGYLPDTFQR